MIGVTGAPSNLRMASFEATVIRADGRIERRGVVAYWHRNPLRRLVGCLGVRLRAAYWKRQEQRPG